MIVDPDDDIATSTAVQQLADREPGVLAISIAPDTRMSAQVVWAVLRALGKRIEQLDRSRHEVWWNDADRWLAAHRIVDADLGLRALQRARSRTAGIPAR